MKIGFLWHKTYPWDVRVEKFIQRMVRDGHEVHLVCKGGTGLPRREDNGSVTIHRVAVGGGRLPAGLARLLSAPLPLNPFWYLEGIRAFARAGIDRLIVRDLPLAMLAGVLGKRLGAPVIFDMAENFPAALVAYNNPVYQPFLVGNAWLPKAYERLSLRYMSHVWVVAEEQVARLERIGVARERISLVMNTPDVDFYRDSAGAGGARDADPDLLYIGKVDAHRGVDLIVRALPAVAARFPRARLTVVGDGTELKGITALAAELGVADRVRFEGWVPFDRVPGFIARSTVCLIPHLRSEHTETTVPNKIFDYMAFGKPVVVSDCAPLVRIVNEERCGCVFRSGDAGDLAARLIALLADPDRRQFGENGRAAVVRRYHWKFDADAMSRTLKRAAA